MIIDRGSKKWTSIFLPEHIARVKIMFEEGRQDEMPELDDFELELIADEIQRAYKSKSTIRLTYWRAGYLYDDYGVPIQIDVVSKSIVLDNPFKTIRYPFGDIVAVTAID